MTETERKKEDEVCFFVVSHIAREQNWSGHNPHTVFLRESESDGDETTDDSHLLSEVVKAVLAHTP